MKKIMSNFLSCFPLVFTFQALSGVPSSRGLKPIEVDHKQRKTNVRELTKQRATLIKSLCCARSACALLTVTAILLPSDALIRPASRGRWFAEAERCGASDRLIVGRSRCHLSVVSVYFSSLYYPFQTIFKLTFGDFSQTTNFLWSQIIFYWSARPCAITDSEISVQGSTAKKFSS